MVTINIKGHEIIKKKIVGISDLKTISTGSMNCDWEWGFKVYTCGKPIRIKLGYGSQSNEEKAIKELETVKDSLFRGKEDGN